MIELQEALRIVLDSARASRGRAGEIERRAGTHPGGRCYGGHGCAALRQGDDGWLCVPTGGPRQRPDRDRDHPGRPDACEGDRTESVCQDHDRRRRAAGGRLRDHDRANAGRWRKMRFASRASRRRTISSARRRISGRGKSCWRRESGSARSMWRCSPRSDARRSLVARRPRVGSHRHRRRTGRAGGAAGAGPDPEFQRAAIARSACGDGT